MANPKNSKLACGATKNVLPTQSDLHFDKDPSRGKISEEIRKKQTSVLKISDQRFFFASSGLQILKTKESEKETLLFG